MFKQFILSSVVVAGLVAAGCASKSNKDAGAGAGVASSSSDTSGLSTSGASDASGAGSAVSGDFNKLSLAERTVYFEFDSSELSASGQAVASRAAKYLAVNPTAKVRLEGHGDERGTREYNVGLGERRANSVQAALLSGGASAVQLSIVSYGEERAVDPGHDETAWAKNRRVEVTPF
ncbi:MAG: peptidoglycan-associated lipoprotein Pal [Panacagrimonas sp.]